MRFFARALSSSKSALCRGQQTPLSSQSLVYSQITQFHGLIETLIKLAVDPNVLLHVEGNEAEDRAKILEFTANLLNLLLQTYLENPQIYVLKESFIAENTNLIGLLSILGDRLKIHASLNDRMKETLKKLAECSI